jgi:hypothetical protein
VVEALVGVRSATVAAAEALSRDWSRLWVDMEVVVRGEAKVPEQLLMDCLRDGEIVRLLGEADVGHLAATWEGQARIRVALDACVIPTPRRVRKVIDLPRDADRPPGARGLSTAATAPLASLCARTGHGCGTEGGHDPDEDADSGAGHVDGDARCARWPHASHAE